MIVRVSKLLVRVLLLLVAVVCLALGFSVWLLMAGPVSVAWLTPYLERELTTATVSLDIEATQLRLGEDHSLDLRAIGVHVRDPNGRLLGQLPEVDIGLSTSALLFERRIAVQRIDAVAPALTLTRRADGSIGFAGVSDESGANNLDIGALLADFLTKPQARGASAHLEHIRFSGGELILEDQTRGRTLRARDAELNVDFLADRVAADLRFGIDQAARPALFHLSASHEPGQDWVNIDFSFENLLPAEFADFAPDLPLSGMRLPFSGSARGAISIAGELEPIEFDVETQAGVIELPRAGLGELPIDALWVQGTLAADLEEVVVDQLSFTTDGAHLSGWGNVAWREGEPTLQADLEAQNVAMDHIARFWPPREGREARAWVTENIKSGTVPAARAQIRFGPGELGQTPLPEQTLAGEFVFEDLTVRYLDTMPPLVGVDGRATFTGQGMDFAVASGHVGDVVVDQGTVVITGIGIKGRDTTQLEISAGISGPLEQALSLIDHPPFGYTSRIGIAPDQASGRVVSDLHIGMPLHRDFDPSEVRVAAEATITNAAITGEPVDVRDGQLKLTVGADTVKLAGDAVLDGVPITVEVEETLGGGGSHRRYQVSGSPDATLLQRFGVDLPIGLEGSIGVSATVTEAADERTAKIALDLTPTTIEVPQLDWRKPAGQPSTLTTSANLPAGGPLRVTAFELTSDELRAEGSFEAQIEPFRLTRLWLDSVHFGDSRASIALRQEDASGYEVRIDAETLDLTPWFGQDRPGRTEQPGTAGFRAPLRLNLQAERLIVDTAALSAVDAHLVREPDGWRSANLTGRLPNGAQFVLTLTPAGERQKLRLTTTDAGDLLRALDTTSQIEGGELELDATIVRQQPSPEAEGRFMVREFNARNAPILARLLTVASLQGIGNLLSGQGIAFQRLEAPFTLRNELLQLGRGRLSGSQLGLTFEGWINLNDDTLDLGGTIVPVYGVNRTIGQIPIIGRLLRGKEGVGAFAFTYGMRGPIGNPTIWVNPLSALAPGFLRELFSGLRAGTLEPPGMLPSHDR